MGQAATPLVCPPSTERSFLERAAQLACCPIGAVAGGARRAERTREVDDPQVTFLLSRGGKHDAAVGRAVPSGEAERVGQIVRRRLRRPEGQGRGRPGRRTFEARVSTDQNAAPPRARVELWGDRWEIDGRSMGSERSRRPGQLTVACSTRSKPESGTMPRACCGGSSAFW